MWGKQDRAFPVSHAEVVVQGIPDVKLLILAFTFTGTLSHYEHRVKLILQEANAIGTAYLRLDLLPKDDQDKLRPLYREYVQSRINVFKYYENRQLSDSYFRQSLKLQSQIWEIANTSVLINKTHLVLT